MTNPETTCGRGRGHPTVNISTSSFRGCKSRSRRSDFKTKYCRKVVFRRDNRSWWFHLKYCCVSIFLLENIQNKLCRHQSITSQLWTQTKKYLNTTRIAPFHSCGWLLRQGRRIQGFRRECRKQLSSICCFDAGRRSRLGMDVQHCKQKHYNINVF